VIIESFRPDQPVIPGTALSYSRLIAGLMALAGFLWLLVRYEKVKLPFWPAGPEEYSTGRFRKVRAERGPTPAKKKTSRAKRRKK
jgi:hypothetical protein